MDRLDTIVQVGRVFGVRDGVLRLRYELERGSGLLSHKMRSFEGWDSWHLSRTAPGFSQEELLAARRDGTPSFLFADAHALRSKIKDVLAVDGERFVLDEAERVLAGNIPYFGALSYDCEFPPRWFRNPATGQSVAPQQLWTSIRFASVAHGDLKFILEPSRFLFIYPLVRAYALSGDERFPQAFWAAVEDWASQSPPMSGPLWICGQECSLRIIGWSFALHGFIHSLSTTSERVALLISMIAAHAWRTRQTLGYARSQRSNHFVAEAAGLWTAGTLYPELAEAEAWQNLGGQLLHEAVLDQITPEGAPQQYSFNYQRMILHLLLWTLRLAEVHKAPLHEDIRERAQAALEFLRSCVDPVSGLAPSYGSDDGSLVFPLASGSYRDYRPLLQLGAAVLDRPSLPPGPWDEPPLWFGVGSNPAKQAAENAVPSVETGYFRIGGPTSWALVRAGKYTRRPFHADQLHVDLWWQGINLARDPGTYLYNGPAPWNNALAGTALHNTITVDNSDQMRRAGRFLWLDWAQASGTAHRSDGAVYADRFEGEHDGYRRIGLKHRRAVQFIADACWLIVDDLNGPGEHDLRLHWLTPDLPFEVRDSLFQVVFNSGESQIQWSMFASTRANRGIVRAGNRINEDQLPLLSGETEQLLGWEAATYGDLRPAISLVCEARSHLPVRFVTVILTDERWSVKLRNESLSIFNRSPIGGSQNQSQIFRIGLSPEAPNMVSTQALPENLPLT
jgi:hypothetical protein